MMQKHTNGKEIIKGAQSDGFRREVVRLRCPACGALTIMPAERCSKCGANFKTASAPRPKKPLILRLVNYAIVCVCIVALVYLVNYFYKDLKNDPSLSFNNTKVEHWGNAPTTPSTSASSSAQDKNDFSIRDYLLAPFYNANTGVISVRMLNQRNVEQGQELERITGFDMEYVYRPDGAKAGYLTPQELLDSYETATSYNADAIQEASQE
jgi:hypothetical protein